VPTNQPMIRDDRHDLVYKTRREKYNAILEEVQRLHDLGFPVLVGTVSVDVSETLSRMFKRAGLAHNVLNAKYHQREAEIIAGAGQPAAVTIATNMAGRGTDIKLGPGVTVSKQSQVKDADGSDVEITEDGGLHIIGSERHESRRIDRQLRGRAGRQGDPGASQFFLSLEDDLMRLFGSERIARLMDRLGAQEGEVLTHPLITRSISQAQKRVELQNFQSRKRLLDYDDVMNQQREVIYSLRSFALEGGEELKGEALKMVEKAVARRVETTLGEFDEPAEWDIGLLRQELLMHYLVAVPEFDQKAPPSTDVAELQQMAITAARSAFDAKLRSLGDFSGQLLSLVTLNVIDQKWKDHLYDLDQLRAAIGYRGWGQKDPLVEYKQEAYTMFVDLMHDIHNTFADHFLKVQLVFDQGAERTQPREQPKPKKQFNALGILEDVVEPVVPDGNGAGDDGVDVLDIGPAESPSTESVAARKDPTIVGAGKLRSLEPKAAAVGRPGAPGASADKDAWANVGRNDPCPCGSGKKYKKCHGAT
jgi:preprotein translocase subunit SecA